MAPKTIPTVALLPDEPACTVATRTAGVVEFTATLSWRSAGEMPENYVTSSLPEFGEDCVRYSLRETGDNERAVRFVSGEISSLEEESLGAALDAVFRAVGGVAALSEAVLETRAIRIAAPRQTPARLVERLGRDLSEAGFEVSFAPAWTSTNGADLGVGAAGMRREVEDFFAHKAGWRTSDPRR